MTPTTWTDEHGAIWPVTGAWCVTCGRPMIPPGVDGAHPTCAPSVTAVDPYDPPAERRPFTPPRHLPGRCPACGHHAATQGHASTCAVHERTSRHTPRSSTAATPGRATDRADSPTLSLTETAAPVSITPLAFTGPPPGNRAASDAGPTHRSTP